MRNLDDVRAGVAEGAGGPDVATAEGCAGADGGEGASTAALGAVGE